MIKTYIWGQNHSNTTFCMLEAVFEGFSGVKWQQVLLDIGYLEFNLQVLELVVVRKNSL